MVGEVALEEGEAGYKKRPRTAPTEQDHNERILLPIKSTDSFIQAKQKIPLTGTIVCVCKQ